MATSDKNTIKFAYHLDRWEYGRDDRQRLKREATPITTTEYTSEMKGKIFCPECSVGLHKSPENKEIDSAGRPAFFAHNPKHSPPCGLRVRPGEGKKYENEELAKQAIANGELTIVHGFMKTKPLQPVLGKPAKFDHDFIEDADGEETEVAIGRHNGEQFKLPSKVTTIRGLCRNFDKNFYRYFVLPGTNSATMLRDLLVNVRTVTELCATPKLYFGVVTGSRNMGKTSSNVRMTDFQFNRQQMLNDFCLKVSDGDSRAHGIDDDSAGKIVLMYGCVTDNKYGLCITHLGWGEFALLPDQYRHLLE
jgi:hypothetical protein